MSGNRRQGLVQAKWEQIKGLPYTNLYNVDVGGDPKADYDNLADAMDTSSPIADGDAFLLGPGTFSGVGLFAKDDITVVGQGPNTILNLVSAGSASFFSFQSGSGNLTIINCAINVENTSASGSVVIFDGAFVGKITLVNCVVTSTNSTGGGGASLLMQNGTLVARDCTFETVDTGDAQIVDAGAGTAVVSLFNCTHTQSGVGPGPFMTTTASDTLTLHNCDLAEIDDTAGATINVVGLSKIDTITGGTAIPRMSAAGVLSDVTGAVDADAIHDNVAGEIAAVTAKSPLVGADTFLVEDSAAANAKKSATVADLRITESQVTDLTHTDANAIHDNVQAEISAVAAKAVPVGADLLLIEDSADSFNKKRVTITTLPSGTPAADSITNTELANMPAYTVKVRQPGTSGDPQDLAVGADNIIGRAGTGNILSQQVSTGMIQDDTVSNAKLSNMVANSVKVNATAGSADPTDLQLTTNTVLGRVGGNIVAAALVADQVSAGVLTNDKLANMTANTIKGNDTAGIASPSDIAVGTNTVLGRVAGNIVAAALSTAQVAANAITNALLAQVSTATFKGRVTGGTGDVEDLTGTQATTLLDVFTSGLKGLAPSSGGGTTNFLRADGTWAAPPAGGGDPTSDIAAADGDITTTSTSDVLATSMTLTPASGTYLVWFSSTISMSGNNDIAHASIWSAGAQVAESERELVRGGGQGDVTLGFSCMAKVTVNGSQAIEGRWRVDSGTGTMENGRQLVILKVA